jgi:hypothetical protein
MTCPYLDYRAFDPSPADETRAYCTVVDEFVQPMRADVCNDRYALEHATHCEIYREHVDEPVDLGEATDATERGDR